MSERALRRIPLDKLMDLKVDFAFKQFFGTERNKQLTLVFLNAILQRTGREAVVEIVFMDQEVGGAYLEDKQSRLDIVMKTQSGELINVEMQLSNQHDMMKRTLYYWSRLFTRQLQKGKGYHTLRPTITINICNFTLFAETADYHSTYHLYDDRHLRRLSTDDDVMEVHFLEMNKFIEAWYNKEVDAFTDVLVRWLLLLGMVDGRKQKVYDDIFHELEALAMNDDKLQQAFDAWEELSQTPETAIAYEARLKFIIDEEAKIDAAKYYGKKEGKEEGKQQGEHKKAREVILTGVKNNVPLETLALLTGYPLAEVQSIIAQAPEK